MATIPDYLYSHFKNQPDREAFVFTSANGQRIAITFRELYVNASILAKSFLTLGVKKSEVIAVSLKNSPEWLYSTYGAMMAGVQPISLSFTYTDGSDVICMMKKLQKCSAIILDPKSDKDTWNIFQKLISFLDKAGHVKSDLMPYLNFLVCRQSPEDKDLLTISEMLTWENRDVVLPHIDTEDTAALFQTSGSTGVPKAIVHTHRSLVAGISGFTEATHITDDVICFNDRHFSWMGGFPTNIISGEKRVTSFGYSEPARDRISYMIDVIRREKCTYTTALPPLINSFMIRQEELGDDWPIVTLRTGGAPISRRSASCVGKLCRKLLCVYAATEMCWACGIETSDPQDFKEFSVGRPFPGVEVKVLKENGERAPVNERGEIYIKSEGLFKEYLNDPEKTKAALSDDGWYRTDDVGYLSEDGLLYCEGRKSDVIITGEYSMNVYPSILESLLQSYPGVARVICVPVPHDYMYQVICACVMLEDGWDVTEDQIRKYCEEIHNDKPRSFTVVPTYYLFLKQFPQTSTGKVSREAVTKLAVLTFLAK